MAIELTIDNRSAQGALERAKAFIDRVRRSKPVYSVHHKGTILCSTLKSDVTGYIEANTPKDKTVKEVEFVPLDKVNELRRKMSLTEVKKKLGLELSVNSLKVMLINAGYIKTNQRISEEKAKRDKKIRELYDKGYTYSMIKEELKLAVKETTIERICRNWD